MLGVPAALLLNQFRVEIVKKPSARRIGAVDRLFFFVANIFWMLFRTVLGGVWARSNLMLIPDFPWPYTISASNLAIPKRYEKKVKLIGPVVSMKPSDLPPQDTLKTSFLFDSRKPLIYAAVSGPKTERTILSALLTQHLRRFPSEYEIAMSRGEPNGKSALVRDGNLAVHDWVENQYEFLKASDLVISRSGHGTIMKAIAFAKPMILVPIPDHTEQYGNAIRACKLGFAELVPQREVSTERLLEAARRLLRSPAITVQELAQIVAGTDAIETATHHIMELGSRSRHS